MTELPLLAAISSLGWPQREPYAKTRFFSTGNRKRSRKNAMARKARKVTRRNQ